MHVQECENLFSPADARSSELCDDCGSYRIISRLPAALDRNPVPATGWRPYFRFAIPQSGARVEGIRQIAAGGSSAFLIDRGACRRRQRCLRTEASAGFITTPFCGLAGFPACANTLV